MGSAVNGSFTMAGLDFSLDLCLDHARAVCADAASWLLARALSSSTTRSLARLHNSARSLAL